MHVALRGHLAYLQIVRETKDRAVIIITTAFQKSLFCTGFSLLNLLYRGCRYFIAVYAMS